MKTLSKSLVKKLETKGVSTDILQKEQIQLQKAVDKAAKTKSIHKNKANRLKSRYARKIAAHSKESKRATSKS